MDLSIKPKSQLFFCPQIPIINPCCYKSLVDEISIKKSTGVDRFNPTMTQWILLHQLSTFKMPYASHQKPKTEDWWVILEWHIKSCGGIIWTMSCLSDENMGLYPTGIEAVDESCLSTENNIRLEWQKCKSGLSCLPVWCCLFAPTPQGRQQLWWVFGDCINNILPTRDWKPFLLPR